MSKQGTVSDLKYRDGIDGQIFLVKESAERQTQQGKLYIHAVFADKTGQITTRLWGAGPGVIKTFRPGGFVQVRGRVDQYKDELQLIVNSVKSVEVQNPEDYLATTPFKIEDLQRELIDLIGDVKDVHLGRLLRQVFDGEFLARFLVSPAAARKHHAYRGGLLEHTVFLARGALALASMNPRLNSDLLVTTALLHDIGKVWEYEDGPETAYSEEGQLLGHIVIATLFLDQLIREIPDFPARKRLMILHSVLAHHGRCEWGSPVEPKTIEAFAFHHLDMLDAGAQEAETIIQNDKSESDFTDWNKALGHQYPICKLRLEDL